MNQANLCADEFDFVDPDYMEENRPIRCRNDELNPLYPGQSKVKTWAIDKLLQHRESVTHATLEIERYKQESIPSIGSQFIPVISTAILFLSLVCGVLFAANELYIYLLPVFFSVIVFGLVLAVSIYLRKRVKYTWKMKRIKT